LPVRAAQTGANIAIAAKTGRTASEASGDDPLRAAAVEQAGGHALPIACDIRDEHAVQAAVDATVERFGGIDILVNNASAISLTGTDATPMKRFDLMFAVNVRGTFLCSQACLPHLAASADAGRNPHILTLAPPLNLDPKWFSGHVAYTMAKYGMSMCVLGMAEEFRGRGIAVNALWPRTVIATSAIAMIPGALERMDRMRRPEILADAAHAILMRDARTTTGRFFIDENALADAGVTELDRYAVKPGAPLLPDLFLD
jgi:citronellol/citronellal dehydrogenase